MTERFLTAYFGFVSNCLGNDFSDNVDIRRYGRPTVSARRRLLQRVHPLLRRLGLERRATVQATINAAARLIAPHADHLQWLYEILGDEESQRTLIQVLVYRALGPRLVRLPLNTPEYWSHIEKLEQASRQAEAVDLGLNNWKAHKFNLASLGYPIQLFFRPTGIVTQFVLQQYRCVTAAGIIDASAGDVVLDAGGCYGDTALYFAQKVGERGKVFSFEFLPENLELYRRNLALNPTLAPRIEVVERPLWSESGTELFIQGKGPGTCVLPTSTDPTAQKVETFAIDDLVGAGGAPRVDFIKMDIEGAELQALKGAEQCIRRFRPKLAITVYHGLRDFWEIPQFIANLNLGYRFYLRHFTIHQEETVLFAAPASQERSADA